MDKAHTTKPEEALLVATPFIIECGLLAEGCRAAIPALLRLGYNVTIELPREEPED